jgi:plastocyanin
LRKFVSISFVAVLAFASVACSKSSPNATPTDTTSTTPTTPASSSPATSTPPAAPNTVNMTDALKYVPAALSVAVGDTVTWSNTGTAPHSVTACTGATNGCKAASDLEPGLDSGQILGGKTYAHAFSKAGTFSYYCTVHPGSMNGTVIVK